MIDKIKQLIAEADSFATEKKDELEAYRIKYLSKKGIIPGLFGEFKNVAPEQKKDVGKLINELKEKVQHKVNEIKGNLENVDTKPTEIDLTLPGSPLDNGTRHPVSIVRNQIVEIFSRLGFTISEGPEIEDDWHVFSALNFPENHPARDMQDTFFIDTKDDILLRTHTSSVQVRVMKNSKPPIRTVSPGRVFRNEAISARAHCIFHQVEGLFIDTDVSFADLKQTLLYFAKEMFGQDTRIRLRPSYFPFTEPSAEMDISCSVCGGKGCGICKHTGWVEILGCGMVDPNVLDNCDIDSNKYTGFAFGMGVERVAMLKYKINDIRLLFDNDVRFLRQFNSI